MEDNLIFNAGFEADWGEEKSHRCLVLRPGAPPERRDMDNIFTPPDWLTWFYHDPGTYDQPEVRDAWKSGDPRRVHSGEKGILLFTFYRKHDAGFLQQVQVDPGTHLELTAWAHAWSNWHDGKHPDNPRWSDGPGYDAGFALVGTVQDDNWRNFTFYVGIDPTGNTDPFADTVVWGTGAHIYNEHTQVPPVTVTAQGNVITVFLRSKTLWTFKHNDAYWDDVTLVITDEPPEPQVPPIEEERGYPRVQYERTYVLLPQSAGAEWAQATITALWTDHRPTIGSSADDAGIGNLNVRRVIAVNPGEWPGDLAEFYDTYYPGIEYVPIEAQSPAELAVRLRPELVLDDITAWQQDPRWADSDLGEDPGGDWTIGEAGCLLCCLTMMLRQAYRRDIGPAMLNRLLAQDGYPFTSDDLLTNWDYTVNLFSVFADSRKSNANYRPEELQVWIENGWLITLRVNQGSHFVYLESTEGNQFHVIDPWDGKHKIWATTTACGIRAVKDGFTLPTPAPPPTLLIGLHDEAGGNWMRAQEMTGVCLAHAQVREETVHLNFTGLESAGIKVLARLNWGYADGTGTVPPPDRADTWVTAMIESIKAAQGVWGFVIGNEWNNPAEWPGGWEHPSHVVTPDYCADLYNRIWRETPATVRMTPASLDPYNVVAQQHNQPGDPAEWARQIYADLSGMEFVALHAKTQTNNPANCFSEAKFTHAPLTGRYLHLRSIEDQLAWIPDRYRPLPVFVTECNPQFVVQDVETGWLPDNIEWIKQTCAYLRTQPIAGVTFYRYQIAGDQAGFGLENKPVILRAIAAEAVNG